MMSRAYQPALLGCRMAFLALSFAFAAHAQFDLVLADGTPVPPVYDLGQYYVGETAAAHFRLRNTSAAAANVTSLSVDGVGFTLTSPPLPAGLAPQGTIDLTVTFGAGQAGAYSAALHSNGIAILLTARVVPSLTYRVDTGGGLVPLATVDFGSMVPGGVVARRVTLRNETSVILTVPAISIQGDGFSLAATPPSGQTLQPQQAGEFTVVFQPRTAGAFQGALVIGDRSYPLLGNGTVPPLPRTSLAIVLPTAAGAMQGTLIVRLDAPAQTTAVGIATLDFRGPADPAIVFAGGGRSANFSIATGDTQAVLAFQTGTTAGTINFAVQLGQAADQASVTSVTIAAAPVGISKTQGTHLSGAIEIRVTGFDNTRTLGALAFTFYDGLGKTLASIPIDSSADFTRFFGASGLGGQFLLLAVFPVSGDGSQVASCDVSLTNATGTAVQRVPLP